MIELWAYYPRLQLQLKGTRYTAFTLIQFVFSFWNSKCHAPIKRWVIGAGINPDCTHIGCTGGKPWTSTVFL